MYSALNAPKRAVTDAAIARRRALPAARLVICDPASLWAETIEAVVLTNTSWQVACVTTSVDTAAAAITACAAHAVLFDVRECSGAELWSMAERMRSARAEVKLILLTSHSGARILRDAEAAGVSASVHKSECSATLEEALQAVRAGRVYRSPAVIRALARAH